MTHTPVCASYEEHLARCYASLRAADSMPLLEFAERCQDSYEEEEADRLLNADPEFAAVIAAQIAEWIDVQDAA